MAYSLRLIGLAGVGARTERRRIPAGPINCREHAMTLCLFRCLIGPSAHNIGRARTEAETKYSTSGWQRTTGVGPLLQNCRSRYWRILSFFEREISDRSKELIFIPYDTPDQQADCTKTSPSRRPFSWLKTSLAQTSSTKCVLRVEYAPVRFLYEVRMWPMRGAARLQAGSACIEGKSAANF